MCLIPVLINLFGFCCIGLAAKETRLSLTAPVTPVEEGGVFGLHCQVWNLKDVDEEVSILKIVGARTWRLSLDDLVTADGENTFIAKRQLHDGSIVFFLSIISVSKQTAGDFRCRVVNTATAYVVTYEDVKLRVMYFPDETDPVCSSNLHHLVVSEGSEIRLNCSSHAAFPQVSLKWTRAGTRDDVPQTVETHVVGDRVSAILIMRPRTEDAGSVYLCEMSSHAFPKKVHTCHIGPISVKPNANPRFISASTKPPYREHELPDTATTAVSLANPEHHCRDICSSYTSQKLYWIIATAGATVIALVFLVLVMAMCLKYYHLEDRNQYPTEKLYSEVESRRVDNRVYMSLVKLKKPNDGTCLQEGTPDGRYHSPNLELK